MKKLLGFMLLMVALLATPQVARAQCPMCRAAVTTASDYGAKESKLAAGLNTGILYLFALPYGALILVGVVLVVHYRRARVRNGQELSDTTVQDVIGDHRPGQETA